MGRWVGYKWASRFLKQFIATGNLDVPSAPVPVSQNELSHNTGVTWGETCTSFVQEYQFASADQPLPDSELAKDIWANSDFQGYVNSKLAGNAAAVQNHNWGSETEHWFAFDFVGQDRFSSGDLLYAIGQFEVTSGTLFARVEKASLKVTAIRVEEGRLNDTYDFDFNVNQPDPIVEAAATLQSAYPTHGGNVPTAGNVFKIRVDLSKEETPWNYQY